MDIESVRIEFDASSKQAYPKVLLEQQMDTIEEVSHAMSSAAISILNESDSRFLRTSVHRIAESFDVS